MKKIFYGILYHYKSIIILAITFILATVILIKINKEFDLFGLVLYYAIIVIGSILTANQLDKEIHYD